MWSCYRVEGTLDGNYQIGGALVGTVHDSILQPCQGQIGHSRRLLFPGRTAAADWCRLGAPSPVVFMYVQHDDGPREIDH